MDWLLQHDVDIKNLTAAFVAVVGFPFVVIKAYIFLSNSKTEKRKLNFEIFNQCQAALTIANEETRLGIESRIAMLHQLNQLAIQNKELSEQIINVFCSFIKVRTRDEVKNLEDIQLALDLIGKFPARRRSILKYLLHKFSYYIDFYKTVFKYRYGSGFRVNPYIKRQLESLSNDQRRSLKFTVDISGSNLSGLNFINLDFSGANLENCTMVGCDIKNTNFYYSNLKRVNFSHSNFWKVNFIGAHLVNSNFSFVDLSGIDFIGKVSDKKRIKYMGKDNVMRSNYVLLKNGSWYECAIIYNIKLNQAKHHVFEFNSDHSIGFKEGKSGNIEDLLFLSALEKAYENWPEISR